MLDYWYDEQLRRVILQFTRVFCGFQYETGKGRDGTAVRRQVPCRYANQNRTVGHILRNNSENTILSTPFITTWVSNLSLAPDRRQDPNFVGKLQVWERAIRDGAYTGEMGRTYSVERLMPVPYDLTMQVDIWTSNEFQKHQLLEQILVLFNPSIDFQTSTNPLDWTALSLIEIQDVTWTSRSMPVGSDSEIEVSSITFKVPIWITPPAKVKRQQIIQQIVVNLGEIGAMEGIGEGTEMAWDDTNLLSRQVITPGNHKVNVDGNFVTLLGQDGSEVDASGNPYSWADLLEKYGKFRSNISQLRLKTTDNLDEDLGDIVGTIQFEPNRPNVLFWSVDVDTLRSNTLEPINGVIDPMSKAPGLGLPPAALGQRYLLLEDIGPSFTESWGQCTAKTNDIIQYHNGRWIVAWDSHENHDEHFVLNSASGKQLRWADHMWILAIDGEYNPGYWRIFL